MDLLSPSCVRRVGAALLSMLTLGVVVEPSARAENPLIDTQVFRPSPHAYDVFDTVTTDLPTAWNWAASAWFSYGRNPLVFVDGAGGSPDFEAIQHQLSLSATGSLTLTDWLSVGLEIPVFLLNDGQDTGFVPLDPIPSAALGDIRVSAKVGLLRRARGGDGLGVGLEIPIGLATGSRAALVSDGWSLSPAVVVDLRLGPVLVAANLGARIREDEALVFGTDLGTEFIFRLAAAVEVLEDRLTVMGEINGASHDFGNGNNTYVEGLLGGRLNLGDDGLHATLGIGRGLAEGYGSTAYRIVAEVGWAAPVQKDGDGDGIIDRLDRCPAEPEDKDGFEDQDGCPDRDNDQDGVLDAADRCPNEAEDRDGYEDEDGCPEPDNDGDGIADVSDKCPSQAEDKDGFQDEDGCPEPDNDGDGILDVADKCPNMPEDRDNFSDEDGCSDPDNDGDGILDADDNCPSDATNKCNVTMTGCEIVITQTVYFEYDKADLKAESSAILDAVASVIATREGIKKVEVQGHTDSDGDDAWNLDLSQRRAEAVVDYLVKTGLDRGRFVARGYGEKKPLESNANPKGRAKNRRVQFIILEPAASECAPTAP